MNMMTKHNGGGGEKTGYLFEKRFHDLLDMNGINHYWNTSREGIDFHNINVKHKFIFADCKGQNSEGTAYKGVPTTIYQYVKELNLKEITIIRGTYEYPSYILDMIEDLEKLLNVKVYIKTPEEFMTWAMGGEFTDVKPLKEYKLSGYEEGMKKFCK